MGENIFVQKKSLFFLNIVFLIYAFSIVLKKIIHFQDGLVDVLILSFLLAIFLIKPNKLLLTLRQLTESMVFRVFIAFILYYIYLSFKSYNTTILIILEFVSVMKWIIYFFAGYIFSSLYLTHFKRFPSLSSLTVFTLIVLIYSLLFYNWQGIGGFDNLFGFYENSFESLFSLRSVFALFGFVLFIYSINFPKINISSLFLLFSSLIFIFMAGNRKVLLGMAIVLFFYKLKGKYNLLFNALKIAFLILATIVFMNTSFYQKSVDEYSNPTQPRIFAYIKSTQIAYDYFPFGPGPATCFSKGSIVNYSPLYYEYGMNTKWGFGPDDEVHFYNDTYWAQIIGQYGIVGLFLILTLFYTLIRLVSKYKDPTLHVDYSLIIFVMLILSLTTPLFQRVEIGLLIFFNMGIVVQKIEEFKRFYNG